MLNNNVSLSAKIIKDPKISEKLISPIHFITKRIRIDTQGERDSTLFKLLEDFDYKAEGEDRKHLFRQACRTFNYDYYPNGDKFNYVFQNILKFIPKIKLSE